MSCKLSLASSLQASPRPSSPELDAAFRMRGFSQSPSVCSDESSDSSAISSVDSFSTISSSSSISSVPYDPRRRISALTNRSSSPEFSFESSKFKYNSKASTEHILVRARNANIPALLRHQQKKATFTTTRRRHTQHFSDADYEEPHTSILQRPKKQKTKSLEQVEAEERRMLVRKAELESDPLLDPTRMCPDRVWCVPCHKYIQIDSRRQYYATLWFKHRGKRHPGVPMKRSEFAKSETTADPDVEMEALEEIDESAMKSPVALAVPIIDDAFATNILADMYSKARGLRLLSLAAAALG
ncbi:hypothetical protein GYMLUDRAFT_72651 [Collybiopsis luxurians FD-317 M1]|uniref:Uncharacterized protein n=1 Tax=Collybiopsis luxurians FD-317 M1 TaxID=944289 RepID=A0A0D0CSS3_9AGAR|nr:hypothetical protein GYMLUDRAFT_72651 [Collybiopsis luxurians FD-317 M1]